jgi:hypothetical protein
MTGRIPLSRPWRYRLAVVLSVAVAAIIAGPQVWPRTEEERAMAAVEDYVEAYLDGDFDEVWDLEVETHHELASLALDRLLSLTPEDPDYEKSWTAVTRHLDLARKTIRDMTPKEYWVACGVAHRRAGVKDMILTLIADAECLEATVDGDRADVLCRGGPNGHLRFHLTREDGDWRLSSLTPRLEYQMLARKMFAFLPKEPVDPAALDLVVEVGAGGVTEDDIARLREQVRGSKPRQVVLDASPDLSWQGLISVYDALHLEEVHDVCFAASHDTGYEDGIRVVPAEGHPAIVRIIACGKPR